MLEEMIHKDSKLRVVVGDLNKITHEFEIFYRRGRDICSLGNFLIMLLGSIYGMWATCLHGLMGMEGNILCRKGWLQSIYGLI